VPGLKAAPAPTPAQYQYPAQIFRAKRFENHDFIQSIDELRRELSTSGGDTGAGHSGAELRIATGIVGSA